MAILGSNKRKYVFVAKGCLEPVLMIAVGLQIIEACGMTPAREPRVDSYPYEGGGGTGHTIFQPLKESYLISDTYYDLKETEVLISTCKPERMREDRVLQILEREIGPSREVGNLLKRLWRWLKGPKFD